MKRQRLFRLYLPKLKGGVTDLTPLVQKYLDQGWRIQAITTISDPSEVHRELIVLLEYDEAE